MKRYLADYDCHKVVLLEHPYGSLVEYDNVKNLEEEVKHLREYTDHLVEFSKLPCLPKDLENLRNANEAFRDDIIDLIEKIKKLERERYLLSEGCERALNECDVNYNKIVDLEYKIASLENENALYSKNISNLNSEIIGWENKWECAIEMAARAENSFNYLDIP